MRRYRFGRLAALVAAGYVTVVTALAVLQSPADEDDFMSLMPVSPAPSAPSWWPVTYQILLGAVHGWLLWLILRGRPVAERAQPPEQPEQPEQPERPETRRPRAVRRLRAVLYLCALDLLADELFYGFLYGLDLPARELLSHVQAGLEICNAVGWLALALLFFQVAGGLPRALRITALVAGSLSGVAEVGYAVTDALSAWTAGQIFGLLGLSGMPFVLWQALTLAAQARDGRWRRSTVWWGALPVALSFFLTPLVTGVLSVFSAELALLAEAPAGAVLSLSTLVWLIRSARDLANPPAPAAVPGTAPPVPARAPLRGWPLWAVAVALPLVPALAALAHGRAPWLGPTGALGSYLWADPHGFRPLLLWQVFDVLIGTGALALLVLAAAVLRTRRLLQGTVSVLLAAAAVGLIAGAGITHLPGPQERFVSVMYVNGGPLLTWLSSLGEDGYPPPVVSPLWYSAALAASALLLRTRYGGGPAPRSRFRAAGAVAATVVALCLLPAADQMVGRTTPESACRPPADGYGRPGEPSRRTAEEDFVCTVRGSDVLASVRNAPDHAVIGYGRRLCGVYTRNDPEEIARVRRVDGVDVRTLVYPLAGICPSAGAVVTAAHEREEREMAEWEAAQRRKCTEAPRHRPRIRPVAVHVLPEPVWTDYGALEAYDPDLIEGDPFPDRLPYEDGVVGAGPGHLALHVHPDVTLCVAVETYPRRPPVETKGWQHVVEVGYRSVSGKIEIADPMGGRPLPDLAVRGKGHYRVRVHYTWRTGGEDGGVQRLLIMSWPGRGDDVVVHRERSRS